MALFNSYSTYALNLSGLPNATDIIVKGKNPGFKTGSYVEWTPAKNDFTNKKFTGKVIFYSADKTSAQYPLGYYILSVSNPNAQSYTKIGFGGLVRELKGYSITKNYRDAKGTRYTVGDIVTGDDTFFGLNVKTLKGSPYISYVPNLYLGRTVSNAVEDDGSVTPQPGRKNKTIVIAAIVVIIGVILYRKLKN